MRKFTRFAIVPAALLTAWFCASPAGAQTATQPNVNPAQQAPGNIGTPPSVGGVTVTNPAVLPRPTTVNPAQTIPGAPNINPAQPVPTPAPNSTNTPGGVLPTQSTNPIRSSANPAQTLPGAPNINPAQLTPTPAPTTGNQPGSATVPTAPISPRPR